MKYRVWECKLVIPFDTEVPSEFDAVPRRAAINAVAPHAQILVCFSGWGGKLTESEQQIVDQETERKTA
jgi:hypothetical protein